MKLSSVNSTISTTTSLYLIFHCLLANAAWALPTSSSSGLLQAEIQPAFLVNAGLVVPAAASTTSVSRASITTSHLATITSKAVATTTSVAVRVTSSSTIPSSSSSSSATDAAVATSMTSTTSGAVASATPTTSEAEADPTDTSPASASETALPTQGGVSEDGEGPGLHSSRQFYTFLFIISASVVGIMILTSIPILWFGRQTRIQKKYYGKKIVGGVQGSARKGLKLDVEREEDLTNLPAALKFKFMDEKFQSKSHSRNLSNNSSEDVQTIKGGSPLASPVPSATTPNEEMEMLVVGERDEELVDGEETDLSSLGVGR